MNPIDRQMQQFADPSITECDDGHRCENWSLCVEKEGDEGNFFCDCDAATVPGVYEGLYCEHEATSYCSDVGSVSRSSFCTNGGKCIEVVGDKRASFACDCPLSYIGDHCQFIEGSQPDEWDQTPAYSVSPSADGGSSKGGAIAGVAIGLIVVIVAVALFVKRSSIFGSSQKGEADGDAAESSSSSPVKSPKSVGSDLELEADGSSSVLSPVESPKTGDAMENEEDLASDEMPHSPSAEDSEII